jgi:hypothetical protein
MDAAGEVLEVSFYALEREPALPERFDGVLYQDRVHSTGLRVDRPHGIE